MTAFADPSNNNSFASSSTRHFNANFRPYTRPSYLKRICKIEASYTPVLPTKLSEESGQINAYWLPRSACKCMSRALEQYCQIEEFDFINFQLEIKNVIVYVYECGLFRRLWDSTLWRPKVCRLTLERNLLWLVVYKLDFMLMKPPVGGWKNSVSF